MTNLVACDHAGASFLTSFECIIHTGGGIDCKFLAIYEILEHRFDGIEVSRGAGFLLFDLNSVVQILTYSSRLNVTNVFNTIAKAEIEKICRGEVIRFFVCLVTLMTNR